MGTIFVDCGANIGEVLLEKFGQHPEWVFHAFEPNPECATALRVLGIPNLTVHEVAVWTEEGQQTLHLPARTLGGTLMTGKQNVPFIRAVEVPTIDLAAWLLGLPPEPVVLKMDIEGAEYPVLPRLIAAGALGRVVQLEMEFHYDRMGDVSAQEHRQLVQSLTSYFGVAPKRLGRRAYSKVVWTRAGF